MKYFQGFVIPVKTGNKQAFLDMANKMAPIFAEYGALRTVECWGDDVMDGKVTDFKKAVQANAEETVVLAWIWWPDKATCDAAHAKIMADDRAKSGSAMPCDGQRMIFGGFEAFFDTGETGKPAFVDGVVASVPDGKRQDIIDHVTKISALFRDHGALRVVDGWGVDVPAGKVTDFQRAVQAKDGETVVFGWIEWPDKPTRGAGRTAMMQDPRMRDIRLPYNGPLAIYGGFAPVIDV
jgi:uncharacterized protein YbaA (DUF1428 family)